MFYVYELQNPLKDNEPFYVGKGKDRRAYRHFQAVEWKESAVAVGAFNSSSIVAACKKSPTSGNRVRTPYGYVWCYEGEQPDWDWAFVKKKPVFLYNDRGDLVARAPNLTQLQQTYGFDPGAVSLALKQRRKYRGFIVSNHPLHKDDFPSL